MLFPGFGWPIWLDMPMGLSISSRLLRLHSDGLFKDKGLEGSCQGITLSYFILCSSISWIIFILLRDFNKLRISLATIWSFTVASISLLKPTNAYSIFLTSQFLLFGPELFHIINNNNNNINNNNYQLFQILHPLLFPSWG